MRWQNRRRSNNIEDRRGQSSGRRLGAGLGVGPLLRFLPFLLSNRRTRKFAIIGGLIFVGLQFFGINLGGLLNLGQSVQNTTTPANNTNSPQSDKEKAFVSYVLASTEDIWTGLFKSAGQNYQPSKLTLFTGSTQTSCGYGQAAMGPFYCPADQGVYIDLSFFAELAKRHKAPGDFAAAYVIAHEVGHHVQTLLGTSAAVHKQKRRLSKVQQNQLSVRQELQADCYAGLWAHHENAQYQGLEPGDIEEGIAAASAIGDDTLQKQAQGHVVPDSFTHGSSEDRVKWFLTGYQSGQLESCDTFTAAVNFEPSAPSKPGTFFGF